MKKLSDYKDDEAIELWADLLEPLNAILSDEKIKEAIKAGKPKLVLAKEILKSHKEDAVEILLRIDPAPLNGMNIILRLVAVLADIGENEEIKTFFGFAEQANKESEFGGSVMENTEVEEI